MGRLIEALLVTLAQLAPFLLLGFAIAGLLHAFVPRSLLTRAMGGTGIGPISRASLLGIPLPLCSCSVIPVATELRRQGAGPGATAAFMVSTPETGVDSISASIAVLHPILVVARPIAAMVTGLLTGLAIEWASPLPALPQGGGSCCKHDPEAQVRGSGRGILGGLRYAFDDLLGEVALYLVPALLISAALGLYLEPGRLVDLGLAPWLQRLAILVVSLPVYVCATAATPVAAALLVAGLSPGATLVFLLAGPATNLATIGAVANNLGRRSAGVYVAMVSAVSIGFGSALDVLWDRLQITGKPARLHAHEHLDWPNLAAAALLGTLILWHLGRRLARRWATSRRQPPAANS
ncbi:MAG: permease [Planctomycetes bacterium]|nr:permease [Planctomycetota bacterium]MCB9888094.1 permease [Planctomycetota bacterium]